MRAASGARHGIRRRWVPAARATGIVGARWASASPARTEMKLPEPPYYAVIFGSLRTPVDAEAYAAAAERMVELAAQQPGYLGAMSARGADGFGITVSYWASEADIARWKAHVEHVVARERGRRDWYEAYTLQVARVERAYGWEVPEVSDIQA